MVCFFEDWDFFSKLGKRHLNSIGNGAKFRTENTKKNLNPFMPHGITHHYQMAESILKFGVVG